jgi:hypothetical protein
MPKNRSRCSAEEPPQPCSASQNHLNHFRPDFTCWTAASQALDGGVGGTGGGGAQQKTHVWGTKTRSKKIGEGSTHHKLGRALTLVSHDGIHNGSGLGIPRRLELLDQPWACIQAPSLLHLPYGKTVQGALCCGYNADYYQPRVGGG